LTNPILKAAVSVDSYGSLIMENASASSYFITGSNPDRKSQTVDIEVYATAYRGIKVSRADLETPSY
jgi:hypothetical protein